MNYNFEISRIINELGKVESVLTTVEAERELLELMLKHKQFGEKQYHRLGALLKQHKKLETQRKQLNRSLSELRAVRSQEFKEANIQRATSKDRKFVSKAYELLPQAMFDKIVKESEADLA